MTVARSTSHRRNTLDHQCIVCNGPLTRTERRETLEVTKLILVLAGESCHDKALSPKQIHLLGTAYLSEERNKKAKKQVCLRQK